MKFFLLFLLWWLWLCSFSRRVLRIELNQHSRICSCCCYSRLKLIRENGLAELLPFSAKTKNIIYLLKAYSFSRANRKKKKYKSRGKANLRHRNDAPTARIGLDKFKKVIMVICMVVFLSCPNKLMVKERASRAPWCLKNNQDGVAWALGLFRIHLHQIQITPIDYILVKNIIYFKSKKDEIKSYR